MAPKKVLSEDQLGIFVELRQIFPNHKKSLIKKTVLRVAEVESTEEVCLHRCIEELVNVCPEEYLKKDSTKQKSQTTLSSIQKDVLNELTQIFSNYDMAVIGTSVCHPSNLVEPLTKQSLLQRCIDDLLDARTAHEAATGTYFKPRNDLKNSADDDVSITQVEEAADVSITQVDEPVDVSITQVDEPVDVSITQVEESMDMPIIQEEKPKDVVISSTEDANFLFEDAKYDWSDLSDDEEELPAVGQVVGLNPSSFSPQRAQGTVSIPTGKQQSPQCSGSAASPNCSRQNEITGTENNRGRVSTPVGIAKCKLATGLSNATAHISLTEKNDNTETLSVSPSVAYRNRNDAKDKGTNLPEKGTGLSEKVTNLSEKLPCEHNSTSLTNTSFSLSRADMFSTSTIESSDSEGSLSNGSFDSQPDDEDLPHITFQKKHLIRDSVFSSPEGMSPKIKLDKNSNALDKNPGMVNLNNDKDASLKESNVFEKNESESDVHLHKKVTSPNILSGIAKDLQSSFQLSPPKLIFNQNAKGLPSSTLNTAQVFIYERNKQAGGEADGKMDHRQDMSHTYTPWVPLQSQSHKTVWSPPRAVGNQQTVTIKSTHKITYNNVLEGNMIGQNTLQNNDENGDTKPHYSMSAPNLTVQMPLDQPRYRERYSTSSFPRTGSMPGSRSTFSVNPTTVAETPNFGYFNNYAPQSIPTPPPSILRPPPNILRPPPSIPGPPPSIPRPPPSIPRPPPSIPGPPPSIPRPPPSIPRPPPSIPRSPPSIPRPPPSIPGPPPSIPRPPPSIPRPPPSILRPPPNIPRPPPSIPGPPPSIPRPPPSIPRPPPSILRPPPNIPRPPPCIPGPPPSIPRPPPSIPRPFPVLRPPTLFSQGATGSVNDTFTVSRPSFVTEAAQGSISTSVPKRTVTNPLASQTAQNPETELDPLPIIIPDDVGLDISQPKVVRLPEQEDTAGEVFVVEPEAVEDEQAEDPILQVKKDVLNLFPEVEPGYLDTLCQQFDGPMAVNNICFVLLENKYPKRESKTVETEKKSFVPTIDYYKDYHSVVIPDEVIVKYQAQAFQTLSQEFSWLSANDIKAVMKKVRYLYAPSYRALQSVWKQAVEVARKKFSGKTLFNSFRGLTYQAKISAEEAGGMECRISVKLLKNRRPFVKMHFDVVPELQREIDFVKYKLKAVELEADHKVAVALNEQEYEDQGQCIECGCCFGEYPFEQMVQCYEGHLFCENCLRQYAKESVFGQGKADLNCMTELCDSLFPKSQLLKALPSEILEKYEDRVTEENLNLADFGDLVKCPHCDFRAFMDPDDKVFRCQIDLCKKETCRYCQVEWEEHFGKKCSEVEKKDETKIRLEYEEKMTKAKVRVCHRCKAQFMKLDGCNKMTCRCGAKMCYICRQPNIDYNHFCRHPRDPGHECSQCKACNLWTNPEEDENRAVAEMQKEAEEERKKKGYTDSKVIGVPDQPPAKKVKR